MKNDTYKTNLYLEIASQPLSNEEIEAGEKPYWHVLTPEDNYNPALIYSEVELSCVYEEEEIVDHRAYRSGPEVVEVEIPCGYQKNLLRVESFAPTSEEDSPFSFTADLVGRLETAAYERFEGDLV